MIMAVMPSRNPNGSRAYSSRGPLFDGAVDGRIVVRRSTQPLLDGCRALLAEGVAPTTPIAMRHVGSEIDALTSTVGKAASLTIEEGDSPLRLRSWKARIYGAEGSPMRQTGGRLPE